MSTTALVSGAEVRLNGQPLDATLAGHVLEVRVDTHVRLPDMFSMRVADPQLEHVDSSQFNVGTSVEVLLAAPDQRRLTRIFGGQITSLEPEFSTGEAVVTVLGYDRSHLLNRTRRTETYQSMSVSDIVRKVVTRAKFAPGTIEGTGSPIAFVQQSNETDWAFLWRLAEAVGYEVDVDDRKVHFRRLDGETGRSPVPLRWGGELLSFRPRVTGVQQVSEVVVRGWDPEQRRAIVASARDPELTSRIGLDRSSVVSALGGGTVTIADKPIGSQAEAEALADAVAGELADRFVEAHGMATGDPRLCAGAMVQITGVGSRFGGTYMLSEATHLCRSGRGYHTQLRIGGRAASSLSAIASTPQLSNWHHSVAVGLVTNNSDPEGLGRVRVTYPTLDANHEGWWARVASPSAGTDRGLLMMPRPGDEVLLAFEHDDDEHPYVLGSLWNGRARPGALVQRDGSFALSSDKQLIAQATEQVSVTGNAGVSLKAAQDMVLAASGSMSQQAQGDAAVQANGTLTLKGVQSVQLGGAQVAIEGQESAEVSAAGQLNLRSQGALQLTGTSIEIQATDAITISAPEIMLG